MIVIVKVFPAGCLWSAVDCAHTLEATSKTTAHMAKQRVILEYIVLSP